jgi:UDP-glucose 4-epimerase
VKNRISLNLSGFRCLVLGGSGFIGRHLCRALVASGATVRSFGRPIESDGPDDLLGEIESVSGLFDDTQLIRNCLREVDVIFHLISTTLPATSNEDIQWDLSSNVLPTLQMLNEARQIGASKVIFISSGGAVYGIPKSVPITEDHPTEPICAYGIQKLMIEKYLQLFHHLWNLDYGVLRVSNPYGLGQLANRPQGVIANFLHKAMNSGVAEVWGDGSVVRDYVYILDVIDACLRLVSHAGPSRLFNIGTGQGLTLLEVISKIEKITGRPMKVRFRAGRAVDVPVNILDVSRAAAELNWRPTTDLETGLRQMLPNACLVPGNSKQETAPIGMSA